MKCIIVFVLFLALGCGTFKEFFGKEEPKETLRPPASHEVIENPDGSYTVIIDESLSVKDDNGVNFTKWLLFCGFIAVIGFIIKVLIVNFYEKRLKDGYDN